MKTTLIILAIAFIATAALAQDQPLPYLQYPALSPDGKTICFSSKGDLWLVPVTGGEARRLTVHPADDIMPQFSPSGELILFTSNRYDNYDLFVIPVKGGEPKRLTYFTDADFGTGWTPDGDTVIFYSFRELDYDIYKVSLNGETPVALTDGFWDEEYFGKITPDGRQLVFNNGSGRGNWWKANLFGNMNSDVFILDRASEQLKIRRVTSDDRHDLWPIYNQATETIYFVANRDTLANLWKIDLENGQESKLTDFKDGGVHWLNSDPAMRKLVFVQGFSIWYFDPAEGAPRKVAITLESDLKSNPTREFTYTGNISEYDLAPDGKIAALIIRGELFVIPTDKPKYARRLTFTPEREQHPCFSADSKTIYYTSDRYSNYDIFSYNLAEKKETRLTSDPASETKPLVSPDSTKLIFYRGLGKIIVYDLRRGKEIDSVIGMFTDLALEPYLEYDFSPDSRYLTFTMAGETYETNIWVTDFQSKPVNISGLINGNYRPRFSPDGKLIYFSSQMPQDQSTYRIQLTQKPMEFDEDRVDSLIRGQGEKKEKPKEDSLAAKKVKPTCIDFSDINKRVSRAINLENAQSCPLLTADGQKYLFISDLLGKTEIWSVNVEGDDPGLTQLTHTGRGKDYLRLSPDSKHVYFLEDGNLRKLEISSQKVENLDFTAEMEIDLARENRQKFDETWSLLDQYFYDPTHHGVDWKKVREKYQPLINGLETENEFRMVIFEMMGELRASHLSIYSNAPKVKKELATPAYGFFLDNRELDKSGMYKIKLVLPNSPAALANPPLKSGDHIFAINGQKLTRQMDLIPLINGLIDKKTTFTVADKPDGQTHEAAVKGIDFGPAYDLAYDYWVKTRRAMVDSLSQGRLAYLHIRAMNESSLEKFMQELVNLTEGKKGVVIDVRYNGGGSTAVKLLAVLIKEPYIMRNFVGYPFTSENKMRDKALEKPSILLINNESGSNSEIFAEGFRKLGLGKIVGTRTAGGVIGTAQFWLIDGTQIRRPSWGAYTTEMENLEEKPRYPDITVENSLSDVTAGRDPQLERAVSELLLELKK